MRGQPIFLQHTYQVYDFTNSYSKHQATTYYTTDKPTRFTVQKYGSDDDQKFYLLISSEAKNLVSARIYLQFLFVT